MGVGGGVKTGLKSKKPPPLLLISVPVELGVDVVEEAGKESPKISNVDEDGVGDRVMVLRPFTLIAELPVFVSEDMGALDETVGTKLVPELMEVLDVTVGTELDAVGAEVSRVELISAEMGMLEVGIGIELGSTEIEALEVGTQFPPTIEVTVEVTVTVKAPDTGETEGAAVGSGLD